MTTVIEGLGLHRFHRRAGTEVAALKDVNLTVAAGETLAVMGPSGSGKSTLLHLLAGLDDPDGGTVWLAGERMSHRPRGQQSTLRARLVGVLTQGSGLVEHLSVAGNVRLAASFRAAGRGRSRPAGPAADADGLLTAVGLGHRAGARPGTLSGGETARASLAVALAGSPPILLADEPTAEVSRVEEQALLDLLRTIRPPGSATVIVTHSARVADAADRVMHLLDGRVV